MMTSDGITSHLGQQHENHVTVVLTQEPHHFLVELYELRGRSIGSKERRQKRAEPPVLQNGLQHSSAFWFSATDEHLEQIKEENAINSPLPNRYLRNQVLRGSIQGKQEFFLNENMKQSKET